MELAFLLVHGVPMYCLTVPMYCLQFLFNLFWQMSSDLIKHEKENIRSKYSIARLLVLPSQVYLSLFGFCVFAFTLDICFYLKKSKYQTVKCRSRKTRLVPWLSFTWEVFQNNVIVSSHRPTICS